MRIAILTKELRYNYGALLQNFALQTVLRRMGHEVVTLDPARYEYPLWKYPFVFMRHAAARYLKGHPEVPIFSEYLRDKTPRTLGKNTFRFVDKYIRRKSLKNIYKEINKGNYDAFIVGSDQVWRWRYNRLRITEMFLEFTKGWDVKRIAYAASFGTDEWECDDATTAICRSALQDFDLVTVREASGVDICREVFGVEAHHVLDPTLLLCKDDYMKTVECKRNLKTTDGSLYLYILDENDHIRQLVKDICDRMNMKSFTYTTRVNDRNSYSIPLKDKIQLPVELWLKGFDQAKAVVTDSFHACVFSILFRKQFYLYANPDRGMARYTSLFNMLGIGDRRVRTIEDVAKLPNIDYDAVNIRIESLREKSMNLLFQALDN